MDILDLETTVRPEWWIKQIAACEWRGGQYLHTLLAEGRFHEQCGEKARVLLLADGTKLASFCVYAERDEIPDPERTPWMGFVYTDPDYRGRRLIGRLIPRVKEYARDDGYDRVWISTREAGLYDKYGAVPDTAVTDSEGRENLICRLEAYGFYGAGDCGGVKARIADYPGIETPKDLYRALWHVWTRETCAPRMRDDWDDGNRTLGQCSITAFLAQDIFGGRVWGVPLEDGSFHCYNVVGEQVFDLTSEQFGGKTLEYPVRNEQLRHDHFMKIEKRERYEALKAALLAYTRR